MKRKTKKQRRDHLAEVIIPLSMAIPVIVAHEEYGFGAKKRAPEFAEKILAKLQEVEEGKMSISQLLERFEELTGMKFE